jgi:hypothetical protein
MLDYCTRTSRVGIGRIVIWSSVNASQGCVRRSPIPVVAICRHVEQKNEEDMQSSDTESLKLWRRECARISEVGGKAVPEFRVQGSIFPIKRDANNKQNKHVPSDGSRIDIVVYSK